MYKPNRPILFNGDSNMTGIELRDVSKSTAAVIAVGFSATNIINLAQDGASNDYIFDTTMAFLRFARDYENLKPKLVVIGWTQPQREQWWLENASGHGQLWEINKIGVGIPMPDRYRQRFEIWDHARHRDGRHISAMTDYWHNRIYTLHGYLESLDIPHLFFNAWLPLRDTQEGFNWNRCFFHPYDADMTYINWCRHHGHQEITPGLDHYDESAQTAWGNHLLEYAVQNNIVNLP